MSDKTGSRFIQSVLPWAGVEVNRLCEEVRHDEWIMHILYTHEGKVYLISSDGDTWDASFKDGGGIFSGVSGIRHALFELIGRMGDRELMFATMAMMAWHDKGGES